MWRDSQIQSLANAQKLIIITIFPRSPETNEPNVEFDVSLLEETENLQANEILWNNLTADSLQAMWVQVFSNFDIEMI